MNKFKVLLDNYGIMEQTDEKECRKLDIVFNGVNYRIMTNGDMLEILSDNKLIFSPSGGCNVIEFK